MDAIYKVAGIVLYTHRTSKGIEQAEVARACNMSQSQYSRIETGMTRLHLHDIKPIAKVLGIPVNRLLGDIFR